MLLSSHELFHFIFLIVNLLILERGQLTLPDLTNCKTQSTDNNGWRYCFIFHLFDSKILSNIIIKGPSMIQPSFFGKPLFIGFVHFFISKEREEQNVFNIQKRWASKRIWEKGGFMLYIAKHFQFLSGKIIRKKINKNLNVKLSENLWIGKNFNTFNFFCTRCGILNVLRKVIFLVKIWAIFLVLNLVNSG